MSGKELERMLGQGDEYELQARDALVYDTSEPKEQALVTWRARCFLAAGLDIEYAGPLSLRRDVDRERVERMVREGATGAQVCAILL
jgi:hypothetical protein